MEKIIDFLAKYPLFFRSKKKDLRLGDIFMRTILNVGAITLTSILITNSLNYTGHVKQGRRIGRIEAIVQKLNPVNYVGKSDTVVVERMVEPAYENDLEVKVEPAINHFSYEEVRDFVEKWRNAWEAAAFDDSFFEDYISRYSLEALVETEQGIINFDKLVRYKRRLNRKDSWRKVKRGSISIEWDSTKDLILVTYPQQYSSSSYQDSCNKMLLLKPELNSGRYELRIIKERCI